MLYAQRIGEHFEERRINATTALSRRPINSIARYQPGQVQPIVTQPTGDCGCRGLSASGNGPPAPDGVPAPHPSVPGDAPIDPGPDPIPVTRASCLECVSKHLGAAYVLLTETREGYAHRLRAIGHLHEAEDESQAWPDLHAAIRAARKAYQADGTIPDWEALAQALDSVRQVAL